MEMRGKPSLLLPLLFFWGSSAYAAVQVKYTAPPAMALLNPQPAGAPAYYSRTGAGSIHALVAKVFEGSDAELQYVPSDSYNMAVQNVMLYNAAAAPNSGIDIAAGVAFDEDNLKYLDYAPTPVYEDFLALAIDARSLDAGFKPDREPDAAVVELMRMARPVALLKLRLDVADASGAERFERIGDAFEAVFTLRKFLIAPWGFVENYIALGASNPKVASLQVFKYRKRKIRYFLALSKAAADRELSSGGKVFRLGPFVASRLAELEASGELKAFFDAK
jgi:hypothetical protein